MLNQKDDVRKTLGYLPQEFGVYPKVSAEDLLDHFALLKGITERRARKEADILIPSLLFGLPPATMVTASDYLQALAIQPALHRCALQ